MVARSCFFTVSSDSSGAIETRKQLTYNASPFSVSDYAKVDTIVARLQAAEGVADIITLKEIRLAAEDNVETYAAVSLIESRCVIAPRLIQFGTSTSDLHEKNRRSYVRLIGHYSLY